MKRMLIALVLPLCFLSSALLGQPTTNPFADLKADETGQPYWTLVFVDPDGHAQTAMMWREGPPASTQPTVPDDQLRQAELQAGSMKLLLDVALSRVEGTSAEAAVRAARDNAAAVVNRLAAIREAQ